MVIHWTFHNTPRGAPYFVAEIQPSIADHIFSFNLAVHKKDTTTWIVLPNFVLGNEAHDLTIQGQPGQDLLVMIKDSKGTEKRLRYSADVFWAPDGDIGSVITIVDYRKYFEESLGLSEQEIYCEAMFDQYKKLEASTFIEAQIHKPGKPYKANVIKPQDLMLRKAVAKDLAAKCESYFENKPAEWFEIQQDATR